MLQIRLAHFRSRGHHIRVAGHGGVVHQGAGGIELLLVIAQGALRRGQIIPCMGQLFLGNGPTHRQTFTTVVVVLRFLYFDFLCSHLRLGAVYIAEQAAHLTHGARQIGLSTLQAHQRIAWVKIEQHLPFVNQVAIIRANAHHGASHQWRDFHHVAIYISVVGAFAPAAIQFVPAPDAQTNENDQQRQSAQPEFAFTLIASVLIVLRLIRCVFSSHDKYLIYSAGEA